eukprot:TRINITY_DN714_c0_g1_i1.p1 TRINITY_DN714_c0_g1~~TRINITY_DN714_c0_g1_i1.p1  ORF type:complete len:702 (-),score=209.11 TRINITY_DN714_c0_g1_i1:142-2121(-)
MAVATVTTASDVTPIQKVVQLLKNMKDKGVKALEEEQVQYANFKQFCDMTLTEKARSIDDATETMEVLKADSEKAGADAARLDREIIEHTASIDSGRKEQTTATGVRENERNDFVTTLRDYTESIDAISRAIKALKAQKSDASKASLLQLSSINIIPDDVKKGINALLMEGSGDGKDQFGTSAGVLEMLDELQEKFLDERMELERAETKKKHAYELLMQSWKAQQSQDEKEIRQKTERKTRKQQEKANANVDLKETSAARDADQKYKDDLSGTCHKKANDFDNRQKLRKEELEAVDKATEIISSQTVAGTASKHGPSLMQGRKKASALVTLRSRHRDPAQDVVQFLQGEAKNLKSSALSALAEKLQNENPSMTMSAVNNIKNLIQNLITKLNQQAEEETTKKAYCDKELGSNEQTRNEKSETVDSISAQMDQLESSMASLANDVAEASGGITELNAAMSKAVEMRTKEKAKNQRTINEAIAAESAVSQAITVLKEFYEGASYATSLFQIHSKAMKGQPEIFGDEPYTGMGGASGGVVGMMEVLQTDFARLEAETTAAEGAAKKEFEEFMEDSKVDKSKKQREVEHKNTKKADQAQELNSLRSDLAGTQKELDAANAYYEHLKPDCVDAGIAYDERKLQREQEIKDLEVALEKLGYGDDE